MTEPESRQSQPISLIIPGKPEYLALGRLVAGAVGGTQSLDEESIADLKLVVTEACTCFLYGPGADPPDKPDEDTSPASIRIEFDVAPEAWQISVSEPQPRHHPAGLGACDPLSERGLGLTILDALVDSVERTETATEGSVIRLVKRFPTPAGIDG